MKDKYIKYIEYIVNDIEKPFFINMIDHYGLKQDEMNMVLSKVYDQPVTIEDNYVYDDQGNQIYYEDSDGYWEKYKYNTNGNEIYRENSNGYWFKREFDTNGNKIYYENSNGSWVKREYDTNGNLLYYENSDGVIGDNR